MSEQKVWLLESYKNYESCVEDVYLNREDAEADRKVFGEEYTVSEYTLRDRSLAHEVTYVHAYLLPYPDTNYRVAIETGEEHSEWSITITDKIFGDGRNVDKGVSVRLVGNDVKRAFEIAHERVDKIKAKG